MKIQIGEVKMEDNKIQSVIIENKETEEIQKVPPSKTRKYLLPCLKEYGKVFTRKLENAWKVAVGLGDAILINRDVKHEKHIFILFDSKPSPKHFKDFMEYIIDQPYYVDDYVYGDIQKSTFHMVILKFPEKYYDAFETFKLGDYSKMFSLEDVEKFFANKPNTKAVLIKEHGYKVVFTRKLNRMFNTELKPEEFEGEYDFKPTEITEIFNHHLKI